MLVKLLTSGLLFCFMINGNQINHLVDNTTLITYNDIMKGKVVTPYYLVRRSDKEEEETKDKEEETKDK